MSWQHPTGRIPARVALVGNGVTHQDYIAECLGHNTPDTVHGRDEVWAINRGGLALRHDVLWVMDHVGGEEAKFPRYGENLRRHDRPIITSDDLEGWPAHVHSYPLEAVRAHFGPAHDYYHNSVAYILAYACWLGVREVTLWGCDYHYDGNPAREPDRANAEYWVAVCRERGMAVAVPHTTTLLNANKQPWFYGYRRQPGAHPASTGDSDATTALDHR